MTIKTKIKGAAQKVWDWDKRVAKKVQEKFKLSDHQMLLLSVTKGFIIGAILL